jgi:spore maturation protein CgeB
MAHTKEAEEIANRGYRYVQERFGLHTLLDQILKKAGEL